MLNLLRFKNRADGIDEGISGREAYERYAQATGPFLTHVGGGSCSRWTQSRWSSVPSGSSGTWR